MANMPLTDIGITPRKASQFASKGIETVTDLLGYYPNKYLDFRNPISFAEGKYHQGEHVAIKGKVVSGRVIDGKHYMLRLSDGNTFVRYSGSINRSAHGSFQSATSLRLAESFPGTSSTTT